MIVAMMKIRLWYGPQLPMMSEICLLDGSVDSSVDSCASGFSAMVGWVYDLELSENVLLVIDNKSIIYLLSQNG